MKFKFIAAATLIALQAAADNWNGLVAAAVEAGISDAATLDTSALLQRITDADPHSDAAAQLQQLTAQITERDATIASQKSKIETITAENARLNALPGAPPATPKAGADPNPVEKNDKDEHAVLTGDESFVEALEKVANW